MSASTRINASLRRAASAVTKGIFDITHNSVALIGLSVLFAGVVLMARPELRQISEVTLFGWLQERQVTVTGMLGDSDASDRATAADPIFSPICGETRIIEGLGISFCDWRESGQRTFRRS